MEKYPKKGGGWGGIQPHGPWGEGVLKALANSPLEPPPFNLSHPPVFNNKSGSNVVFNP